MGLARTWTKEEVEYLEDKWGTISIPAIAKKLNRSEGAIILKAQKIGLGAFLENGGYITFNQLLYAIGLQGSYSYKQTSWVENRKFPLKTKKVKDYSFRVVYIDDFWSWAEQNKGFLDFSNFEENALGKEPGWVKEKRRHDWDKKRNYISTPWTIVEDKKLEKLLKEYKYTYIQLSKILRRTNGAIQRRICDLGLKERPLRESPQSTWEGWQLQKLYELIQAGVGYEYMQDEIGKSAKAIRGKVYCLYGTEKLDRARENFREVCV